MTNKEVKLERLGDIGEKILEAIAVAGLCTIAGAIKACSASLVQGKESWRSQKEFENYIDTTVYSLIERGILVKDKDDKQIKLTTKGKWESARRRYLDEPTQHMSQYWDNKWRVIIFDIPELERSQRDKLRRAFNRYGMYLLQQSVWVYPYQCDKFVVSLKEDLGFKAEVLYMLVEQIENQGKLEEEFGLL